jgi:4-hydroxybenzoate polyprenyltransferase
VATAVLVALAGGGPATIVRLAAAMVALQASIGALNDIRDARADATTKPSKPIPAGLARPAEARLVVVGGLVIGLLLSTPSGSAAVVVAVLGVASGYAYDLWLKPTPLSFLPLAVALPLQPAFAFVGVGAGLPPGFAVLVPLAVAAGTGLAIANALADVERDRRAGLATIVERLGPQVAWRLHAGLQVAVAAVAIGALSIVGGRGPGVVGTVVGGALLVAGTFVARAAEPADRERAWEIEAIATAIVGVSWLAAISAAPS